jgi:hypothetical protein
VFQSWRIFEKNVFDFFPCLEENGIFSVSGDTVFENEQKLEFW